MAKSSKFSRRQRKIAGRSVSRSVQYLMPKMPRSVDALPLEVEFRLRCVQHALASSVADAAQVFRCAFATVYRWKKAYLTGDFRDLQSKSRRPKQTRKRQWSAAAEAAVLRLRYRHHRFAETPQSPD